MKLPEQLMLLPAASRNNHAKISALQDYKKGLQTTQDQDCGQKSLDLLATYNLISSSWKTSQTCLLALLSNTADGLAEFSEIWPRSGMMRNGIAYRLPILEPGIHGTEFGYLPTPLKSTAAGSAKNRWYQNENYKSNLHEYLRNGPDDPKHVAPAFCEKLMGFPIGHTDLDHSETP